MKKIKIILIFILICLAAFLIQTSVLSRISFFTVYPNLLIIITSVFGFMRGQKDGILVGLLSGFLMDIFFDSILGFYMLLYMLAGFFNGHFQRLFFDDDVKLPVFLVGVSDLAYDLVVYFVRFMLHSDFHFRYYLLHIIIPEMVFTCLVTVVIYRILLYMNRKIEAIEKRSAGKFV